MSAVITACARDSMSGWSGHASDPATSTVASGVPSVPVSSTVPPRSPKACAMSTGGSISNSCNPVARIAGVAPSSASEPFIGQRAKSAALARKLHRPVTSRPSSTRVSMSMVQDPRANRVRTRPVAA